MSINSKMNQVKCGEFESWMNVVPNISLRNADGVKSICLGIDSGSTYTRFCPYSNEENEFGALHQINSDVVNVRDISNLKSNTDALYSNLEFIIQDLTSIEKKPDRMFNEAHFVKGDLMVGMPGSTIERSSRISKTKLESTFFNIFAAIALEIIHASDYTEVAASCYQPELCLTMPPKDFLAVGNLTAFKKKLAGIYYIRMPRIGFSAHIDIRENAIFMENEPTAVAYSLAAFEDDSEESILDKTAIIIDGGGGTTDMAVLIDGQLAAEQATTGEYGGKKLLECIARTYTRETGKSQPALSTIESALADGILIRGNTQLDISKYIAEAKQEIAQYIINDLNAISDSMNKSLDDVNEIILHGRLFNPTVTSTGETISVADCLMSKIVKIAPDVRFQVISENNSVVEGAILSRWMI